jgi:hypothetical protein
MIAPLLITVLAALALFAAAVAFAIRARNMQYWLWGYLTRRKAPKVEGTKHIMFCFVDHFEPNWGRVDVDRWCSEYRAMASRHRDADGRPPQHCFFYPEEEYVEEHLDKLAHLCADGFGEIEIHLHHDNDTPDNFVATIDRFNRLLHQRHGALPRDPVTGQLKFAFIHGNWCLANSRPDGRWCGINHELGLLRELGCYADFTLPSAPSDTQTKTSNSIYYAADACGGKPKGHDTGVPMRVGGKPSGDLLIIQGVLGLNWKNRRFGIIPRIENSDIRKGCPPTRDRVDQWVDTGIHVEGRPEWIFIKIHTHGTQERDMDTLLGKPVDDMHDYLEQRYNDGKDHVLHYVTAREMYNIAKAAEAGMTGNPNLYRDFELAPPGHTADAPAANPVAAAS